MTAQSPAEQALRALFANDTEVIPDRVLDAIAAELPLRRQHRRWWTMPWTTRRVALLVAAVAIVVAGIGLTARPGGTGAPPAASPTASPAASPSPGPTTSATPLQEPGTAQRRPAGRPRCRCLPMRPSQTRRETQSRPT